MSSTSHLPMDDFKDSTLVFRPVDLDAHLDTCIRFRIDTHVCGFGSAERFHESDGKGANRYADWLKKKAANLSGCLVHLWQGETIIGQIEMGRLPSDSTIGYVNLFYLIPQARGQGMGALLEAYAWTFLSGLGCRSLRLSANPANAPAWSFYRKQGWQDLGPREDDRAVHVLEKRAATSAMAESVAETGGVVWASATGRKPRVPFILTTPRLKLVPPDICLAEALANALNASYELHRDFLEWSKPHWTPADASQSMEGAARDFYLAPGEKRYFLLPRGGESAIVGCIGLLPRSGDKGDFEVGYWASQTHAGNGLMREALSALLSTLKDQSLYLTTSSANAASQRLAESVGFERAEVIVGARQSEKFGVCDTFVYRHTPR